MKSLTRTVAQWPCLTCGARDGLSRMRATCDDVRYDDQTIEPDECYLCGAPATAQPEESA